MAESDEKGYKVTDRRYLHLSDEEKAKIREEETARQKAQEEYQEAAKETAGAPLPDITFSAFLISLSSSAFVHLGDMPDPVTGETKKNLPLAKQTIDLLGLLREKTRNNLEEDEEKLFDHLLYDLRMRYIKEAS
ncbi:MAG: DUF1844 domain-containing protein [Deltaproteobacteria bacterium]|nr:DUF1844 domain-containing protein [Deltaproteobacteria bacterium]